MWIKHAINHPDGRIKEVKNKMGINLSPITIISHTMTNKVQIHVLRSPFSFCFSCHASINYCVIIFIKMKIACFFCRLTIKCWVKIKSLYRKVWGENSHLWNDVASIFVRLYNVTNHIPNYLILKKNLNCLGRAYIKYEYWSPIHIYVHIW